MDMVITPFRRRTLPDEALPTPPLPEEAGEILMPELPREIGRRDFSFHLFFLVFWLTLVATILLSWQMIVVQP
jgi:hypothetical protein